MSILATNAPLSIRSFTLALLGKESHLLARLEFRIILEARNPARRCSRQYRVEAGTDLFGVWVVEIGYGRIGTAGRSRSYVVRDEEEARHLAQSILKRRATAPRRIGVAYRVRELIDPEGWAWSYEAMLTSTPSPAGDFSGPSLGSRHETDYKAR